MSISRISLERKSYFELFINANKSSIFDLLEDLNNFVPNGGALVTNFKLPELCGRDVLDLIDTLQELGYSLKPVIEILNRSPEKKSQLIL